MAPDEEYPDILYFLPAVAPGYMLASLLLWRLACTLPSLPVLVLVHTLFFPPVEEHLDIPVFLFDEEYYCTFVLQFDLGHFWVQSLARPSKVLIFSPRG